MNIENPVNCWKIQTGEAVDNQQPSPENGKVQRLEHGCSYTQASGSAGHPVKDDDIVCSPEKSGAAKQGIWKLYKIINNKSNTIYYGITSRGLNERFNCHKSSAKSGRRTKLYSAIRKYGIDNFKIELVKEFDNKEDCCNAEIDIIKTSQNKLYNLAKGGEIGYSMSNDPRYNDWVLKLKEKRKDRKPALGMKHSETNKEKFSECGKLRWDIYGRYPEEVTTMSFKDAKIKYGISKTHYYRMRRLASDQS